MRWVITSVPVALISFVSAYNPSQVPPAVFEAGPEDFRP